MILMIERLLERLVTSLDRLSAELAPIHVRLITLRRLLASIASRPRVSSKDTLNILTELRAIEDKRLDGKFVVDLPLEQQRTFTPEEEEELSPEAQRRLNTFAPPLGQELLAGLLDFNFELCQDIQAREGAEDLARGPLQPIYDRLSELRGQLERLVLTHRWTLRETVSASGKS